MGSAKLVGLVLLIAGVLAIAFGSFSYTKEETEAKLGPFTIEVKEKESVNIPLWAGLAVTGLGAALLLRVHEPAHCESAGRGPRADPGSGSRFMSNAP